MSSWIPVASKHIDILSKTIICLLCHSLLTSAALLPWSPAITKTIAMSNFGHLFAHVYRYNCWSPRTGISRSNQACIWNVDSSCRIAFPIDVSILMYERVCFPKEGCAFIEDVQGLFLWMVDQRYLRLGRGISLTLWSLRLASGQNARHYLSKLKIHVCAQSTGLFVVCSIVGLEPKGSEN